MNILSIIYPRRCAICDDIITDSEYLCAKCKGKIRPISGDTCRKCGKRLKDSGRIKCLDCSGKMQMFERNLAIFEYQDVKDSLYRFKYKGRAEYARLYAYAAMKLHGRLLGTLNADAIIPVPIHPKRFKKRGYNQASELGRHLSAMLQIPLREDIIIRQKNTIPLKKLGEADRRNNLKKAFIIKKNDVKLKTVILVDDIYTTGATLSELSSVLKEAGVKQIYCLTVAIGDGL